jgi:hypothetical protein
MTTVEPKNGIVEHAIGQSGSLSLRVASWDLDLTAVDGDIVRVRALSGSLPPDLEVEPGPGSLTIRQPMRSGLGGLRFGRNHDVRLGIEVPAGATVDVQTASGDVATTGLVSSQHMRSASGDLTLRGAAGVVGVETMSGDVAIELAAPARIALRSVSGDVAIRGGRADDVSITTTSGDIELMSELGAGPHAIATISGDAELVSGNGVRVIARTVAGDLRTSLPHTTQGGAGRRGLVVGDGAIEVQFKSVSGDLRVVGRPGSTPAPVSTPQPPPEPPEPPTPPAPPLADWDADAVSAARANDGHEALRLAILKSLERGEIALEEASARLADLDGPSDD